MWMDNTIIANTPRILTVREENTKAISWILLQTIVYSQQGSTPLAAHKVMWSCIWPGAEQFIVTDSAAELS